MILCYSSIFHTLLMSVPKKIKILWRKTKENYLFVVITAILCSIIAAYLYDYLKSEEGKKMIEIYLAFLQSYYGYFLNVAVFLLTLSAFWIGYFLSKARFKVIRKDKLSEQEKTLTETHQKKIETLKESHKTELQKQSENLEAERNKKIKEIESLYTKRERQRQTDDANRGKTNESMLKSLTESRWLFDLASEQAKDISNYVLVASNYVSFHSDTQKFDLPYIAFQIQVFNVSVFDISFEKDLDGLICFRQTMQLHGQKWLKEAQEFIKPNTIGAIWIFQQLNEDTVNYIEKTREAYKESENAPKPEFHFDRLEIKIKSFQKTSYTVNEQKLKIGRDVKADLDDYPINL